MLSFIANNFFRSAGVLITLCLLVTFFGEHSVLTAFIGIAIAMTLAGLVLSQYKDIVLLESVELMKLTTKAARLEHQLERSRAESKTSIEMAGENHALVQEYQRVVSARDRVKQRFTNRCAFAKEGLDT